MQSVSVCAIRLSTAQSKSACHQQCWVSMLVEARACWHLATSLPKSAQLTMGCVACRSTACHASTSSLSSPAWAPGPQIDVRGPLRGHASTAPTASASKAMAQSAGGSAFRALPLAHVSVPVGEHVAHQHQRFSTAARATSSDQAPSAPAEADASDDNDDLAITCLRCTVSDLPGEEADMLSDVLLSFGAQSVV